jgi:hypothetical protein
MQTEGMSLWPPAVFFYLVYFLLRVFLAKPDKRKRLGADATYKERFSNLGPAEVWFVSCVYILLVGSPIPFMNDPLTGAVALMVIAVIFQRPIAALRIEPEEVFIGISGMFIAIKLGTSFAIFGSLIQRIAGTM